MKTGEVIENCGLLTPEYHEKVARLRRCMLERGERQRE